MINRAVILARHSAAVEVSRNLPRPDLTPVITGFTGTRRHGNKRTCRKGENGSTYTTTSPSYTTPGMTTHDSRYDQTLTWRNV